MELDKKYNQFFNIIASLVDINDEEKLYYSKLLSIKHFKKGEFVLNAGDVCRNVF